MTRILTTLTLGSLAAVTFAGSSRAATVLVTFEDIPITGSAYGYAPIPAGYAGLQWNNFFFTDATDPIVALSGYANSVVTPVNVAFNLNGDPAFLSATAIDLNSLYMTAAWNDGLQVQIDGFNGSTLLYSNTYTVDTTHPTFLELDYLGVDKVVFTSSGGTPVPGYAGEGTHFAMDNLSVTVPEPSSSVLLALAIAGAASWRRRRGGALHPSALARAARPD